MKVKIWKCYDHYRTKTTLLVAGKLRPYIAILAKANLCHVQSMGRSGNIWLFDVSRFSPEGNLIGTETWKARAIE